MTAERLLIESLLRIPDKEGRDVDFILNADQATFDRDATGRDIIAKYRQGGFSTYPLGRALVRCLAYRNRRHVILAHNTDTSQKLLARIHYMIKHIRAPEPNLRYATQNRIVFNKTDSSIFIGTAGSDDYGVGDTITDLHCSEVSRWPNPQALLSGLFQAVPPSGNILLESTGRGVGNWFHQAVVRASRDIGYKLHFFHWLNTPEYSTHVDDESAFMASLDETLEEPTYARLGLSAGQLAWRRIKLAELNYDLRLFRENYPVTLDECFQATGYGVFRGVNFEETGRWVALDPWSNIQDEHPKRGRPYVAGVDIAGGTGQDFSVIEIIDAETGEQVYEYRNSMIEPDKFAHKAAQVFRWFEPVVINPERNNHGILFIKELLAAGFGAKLHRPKRAGAKGPPNEVAKLAEYGTYTTSVVKSLVIGTLQRKIREDICIHSDVLRLELASFVEKDNGQMEAEVGCFDDCVMALAMAAYVQDIGVRLWEGGQRWERANRPALRGMNFGADAMIEELTGRWSGGGLPIREQVAEFDDEGFEGWPI